MINAYKILSSLSRPKILIRAARLGLCNYNRESDLRLIAKTSKTPRPESAIRTLLTRENDLEDSRKQGLASYSVQEHIRVLTALLAEARLPSLSNRA